MTTFNEQPEIDPQHVIAALVEENKAVNDNRLYLMALLRQIKFEFEQAQQLWKAEKESLTKKTE